MKKFLKNLLLFFGPVLLLGLLWLSFVVCWDRASYFGACQAPDGATVLLCGDSQGKDALDPAKFPGFFNFCTAATTCDQDLMRLKDVLAANPGRFTHVLLDASPLKIGYDAERPVSELNAARVHLLLHVYHRADNRRPFGAVGELVRDVLFTRKFNECRKALMKGRRWRSSMAGGFSPTDEAGFLSKKHAKKANADVLAKAARLNERPPATAELPFFAMLSESAAVVRAAGAQPVFLTLPLSPVLLAQIEDDRLTAFSAVMRRLAAEEEVPYLDFLREPLALELWHDGNHLNTTGASVFTPRFVEVYRARTQSAE